MSRAYGVVQTAFWTDPRTNGMSDRAKILALYLLSGPHSNAIGCFRLPLGYIAEDLRWSMETVTETIAETVSRGFIKRCENTGFVFIPNFLKHNAIQNPNVLKSALPFIEAVPPNVPFYNEFLDALKPYAERFSKGLVERLAERSAEPYAQSEPILTEPIRTQNQSNNSIKPAKASRRSASAADPDFDRFWQAYPKRVGRGQAERAFAAAKRHTAANVIVAGAKDFAETKPDPQYTPHPATWLNGKRWLDERLPLQRAGPVAVKPLGVGG